MKKAFLFFVFLSLLAPAISRAEAPKNPLCRATLQAAGAESVKDWLAPRLAALEAIGIDRQAVEDFVRISPSHLDRLRSGRTTNLGTGLTKAFSRLFDVFLTAQSPDERTIATNAKIRAALAPTVGIATRKERQKALYAYDPNPVPVPQAIAAKTTTPLDMANHYLKNVAVQKPSALEKLLALPMNIEGDLGGYHFWGTTQTNNRFLQTDFVQNPSPGERSTKVYINLPQNETLEAELPGILARADKAGAGALKFNGFSPHNLPDRIVVYFADAERAIAFAQSAAQDFKSRNIRGGEVPFTFRIGDSPVALGADPEKNVSWRGKVTKALAVGYEMFGDKPNRDDLIRRTLIHEGIDPETWLPLSFTKKHAKSLGLGESR